MRDFGRAWLPAALSDAKLQGACERPVVRSLRNINERIVSGVSCIQAALGAAELLADVMHTLQHYAALR